MSTCRTTDLRPSVQSDDLRSDWSTRPNSTKELRHFPLVGGLECSQQLLKLLYSIPYLNPGTRPRIICELWIKETFARSYLKTIPSIFDTFTCFWLVLLHYFFLMTFQSSPAQGSVSVEIKVKTKLYTLLQGNLLELTWWKTFVRQRFTTIPYVRFEHTFN